jgi:hypothetical protein
MICVAVVCFMRWHCWLALHYGVKIVAAGCSSRWLRWRGAYYFDLGLRRGWHRIPCWPSFGAARLRGYAQRPYDVLARRYAGADFVNRNIMVR